MISHQQVGMNYHIYKLKYLLGASTSNVFQNQSNTKTS